MRHSTSKSKSKAIATSLITKCLIKSSNRIRHVHFMAFEGPTYRDHHLVVLFVFLDRRPTCQCQGTWSSWPPIKYVYVKYRGDFTAGNRTANLFPWHLGISPPSSSTLGVCKTITLFVLMLAIETNTLWFPCTRRWCGHLGFKALSLGHLVSTKHSCSRGQKAKLYSWNKSCS